MPEILVLFASKSDEESYNKVISILKKSKVSYDFKLASAHKTPEDVDRIASEGNYKVVISGAGLAAALPGAVAAKTIRPVIGIPCPGSYEGLDALLSIMQMPPGIPVLGVGASKAGIAAYSAIKMLKGYKKIALVGDKNNDARKKAEEMLKKFEVSYSNSDEAIDNAINIFFTYFDEQLEEKKQLVIYCPLIEKKDDKAEAALNLLKHTEHGLWVGLNNGTNAAIAAIEILNLDNSLEQQLISYRKEIGGKVRRENK